MRILSLITLLSISFFGMSKRVEAGLLLDYQIISDEFDASLDPGTYQIFGTVKTQYSNEVIDSAIITDQYEEYQVITSATGDYSIVLPHNIQTIYCYKDGLTESILDKYEFKDQHKIHVNFYLSDPKKIVCVTKPVVYLYNCNEPISISIQSNDILSFTYPQLNERWNIRIEANGMLKDQETGKKYPYLFWEAESRDLDFQIVNNSIEGYVIKTDTCISFLEHNLNAFGFNTKEKTDFITFWAPTIIKQEFALIQYLVDDQYDEVIAGMECNPEPDNIRRVYMLYKGLDAPEVPFELVSPELKSVARSGFTLIEWGGSVITKEFEI